MTVRARKPLGRCSVRPRLTGADPMRDRPTRLSHQPHQLSPDSSANSYACPTYLHPPGVTSSHASWCPPTGGNPSQTPEDRPSQTPTGRLINYENRDSIES